MFSQIIWWVTNLLIAFLLVRALSARLFIKYPVFYSYLTYVLIESLIRFYFFVFRPGLYEDVYWNTQFLSVALGYCVIYEIYTQALASYAGVSRLARVLLLTVFVVIVSKVLATSVGEHALLPAEVPALLERDLRAAQAALLAAIVCLLVYYAIPVGINVRGMVIGYGVFVAASVVSLTLRSHFGIDFQSVWQYFQPAAYLLTLTVWCASLWSYQPNPQPWDDVELEGDYEWLAVRTSTAVSKARGYLVRALRP
ncbi:MAG: hypothetical protein L0338_13165 [Acidobacteria bacterium]|nr:hypothetical protein [Acidobacteriota bacterium]